MLRAFVLAGVFAVLGCFAQSGLTAAEKKQVEGQIEVAFAGLVDAAKAMDAQAYLAFFDRERFTALNADGTVTHDFASFANFYRQQLTALAKFESLTFDRVKVQVLDQRHAILVNEYVAKLRLLSGDVIESAGAGTQVWALKDGKWLLVSVSSSATAAGE